MSDVTGGSVPGGDGSAATVAPDSSPHAADQSQVSGDVGAAQSASGDLGVAPGVAVDAAPAAEVVPPAPSEFLFGGRRFTTQKQAEDFYRSQAGRVPEMQRKTAEQERQIAELSSTVQALQRALSVGPQAVGQEPGSARGVQTPAGSKPFADRLVESGDLQFITELAEQKGLGHAIYALADIMDNEINQVREQIRNEEILPITRQSQFREVQGRALGVARGLGSEFPELDYTNQSPEAVETQQAFVSTLKQFPPEFVAANPEFTMLAAALVTRHQQGIPVFAQQPGTSGSPSALAAAAAEAQFQVPGPIDGSSARPRPAATQPRTAEDQFEADIIGADDKLARTLEGKPLGWRRVS